MTSGPSRRVFSATRRHRNYLAFLGHRLSGLALAVFLPLHFLLLGLSLEGAARLDRALVFTDLALVKFAEWALVVLLVIHLLFGLRVLMLEMTRWPGGGDSRSGWIIPALVAALLVGLLFLFQSWT